MPQEPAFFETKLEDQVTDMLPSGAPLQGDFWQAMSFEELAASQDVKPFTHIAALAGTWPGDMDDDFEDAIHKLRLSGTSKRKH